MSGKILKEAIKHRQAYDSDLSTYWKGSFDFIKRIRKETGCSLESGKNAWVLYRYFVKVKRNTENKGV